MATTWIGYVDNWRAMASENGYVNNNNGTVTIRINLIIGRGPASTGTGTLVTSTYYLYNGSTVVGSGTLDRAGWTSAYQQRTIPLTVNVAKTASARTWAYADVGFRIHWGDNWSNIHKPSSKTLSWTIPALSKFTVSFNANGGSGAPASQTKTEAQSLVLSSVVPVRKGYAFKGWATSASATTAQYQPGSTYTGNANLSLYAVWEKKYSVEAKVDGAWKTGVTSVKVNGTWHEADLVYVKVNGSWKTI